MSKILVDTNILVYVIISIGLVNGINQIATFNSKDFEDIEEVNIEKFIDGLQNYWKILNGLQKRQESLFLLLNLIEKKQRFISVDWIEHEQTQH